MIDLMVHQEETDPPDIQIEEMDHPNDLVMARMTLTKMIKAHQIDQLLIIPKTFQKNS